MMQNGSPSLPENLGHHKSCTPWKELLLEETICPSSPFFSDTFNYTQLNKYSSGEELKPRQLMLQAPLTQNLCSPT